MLPVWLALAAPPCPLAADGADRVAVHTRSSRPVDGHRLMQVRGVSQDRELFLALDVWTPHTPAVPTTGAAALIGGADVALSMIFYPSTGRGGLAALWVPLDAATSAALADHPPTALRLALDGREVGLDLPPRAAEAIEALAACVVADPAAWTPAGDPSARASALMRSVPRLPAVRRDAAAVPPLAAAPRPPALIGARRPPPARPLADGRHFIAPPSEPEPTPCPTGAARTKRDTARPLFVPP
jgi:hypothetical protein